MLDSTIRKVTARKIRDSRGNPTIEVELYVKNASARASAPAGASTGTYEARAFPEEGIDASIELIKNDLRDRLLGMRATEQTSIDEMLKQADGTGNFSRIGASAAIAISMAAAKTAARSLKKPLHTHLGPKRILPFPLSKMLGGGKHAMGLSPDIQEFLACPIGAKNIEQALLVNTMLHQRISHALLKKDRHFVGGRDDEGGWASTLTNKKALDMLKQEKTSLEMELKVKIGIGIDVAASSLYNKKKRKYIYQRDNKELTSRQQMEFMRELMENYSLFYLEDPFHEDDYRSFSRLTKKAGSCMICGDDLFVTNPERIRKGISLKACDAVIIKPNQIGTVTDTVQAIQLAKENGYVPVVSHRSAETEETFIAHLAVAFACPMLKTSTSGGERLAKLNELIRIQEEDIKLGVI